MCIFVPLSFIFPLFLHSTFTFPSHSIPVPLSPPPVCIARSAYFRKLCLPFLKTLIRFHSDETLSRSRNRKDTSLPCCSGHSEKRLAVFVGELARLCSAWKREGRGGEGGKYRGEISSSVSVRASGSRKEEKGRRRGRCGVQEEGKGREGCFRKFRSLKRKIDSGPPPSAIHISDAHAVVTSCRTPARVSLRSRVYLDTHVIGSQVEILVAGWPAMEQEEGDAPRTIGHQITKKNRKKPPRGTRRERKEERTRTRRRRRRRKKKNKQLCSEEKRKDHL